MPLKADERDREPQAPKKPRRGAATGESQEEWVITPDVFKKLEEGFTREKGHEREQRVIGTPSKVTLEFSLSRIFRCLTLLAAFEFWYKNSCASDEKTKTRYHVNLRTYLVNGRAASAPPRPAALRDAAARPSAVRRRPPAGDAAGWARPVVCVTSRRGSRGGGGWGSGGVQRAQAGSRPTEGVQRTPRPVGSHGAVATPVPACHRSMEGRREGGAGDQGGAALTLRGPGRGRPAAVEKRKFVKILPGNASSKSLYFHALHRHSTFVGNTVCTCDFNPG